jgi:glycosyltransferase involved in cell wall biosynthesis
MKTSIIIPVYNHEQFVAQAIESALNQTVPCEVIIIDDGSTDKSKFIVDEYEDRAKVIHQTNRGLAAARNTGIMNATGEYILPLDSDDILEPNCVEKIEKVFADTDADVIAPSFTTFGAVEQLSLLMTRPTLDDFKVANRIGYCSAIKRALLLEVGGYSVRMVWGYEDYHLWFVLLRKGKKIYTIPEPLWRYRTREGSMIQTAQKHHDELMAQIAKDNPGAFI